MKKNTFTKVIISRVITIALIDLQLPFILSAFDKDPVVELGKVIAVEIIGVVLVYCLKSFFETREEENNKLKKESMVGSDEVEG